MIPKIEPPLRSVDKNKALQEQIKDIRNYLSKLAEDINYALGEIERRLDNSKEE